MICGANTVGRQKLRYQQVLHSSPLEYQRLTQEALNQGSCSAAGVYLREANVKAEPVCTTHVRCTEQTPDSPYAGQSGLMALWDKLFTMLGVGSAQLLVSPDDFEDEETSKNLQVCVEAILSMGAVPILNENPAASTSFSEVC